MDSNYFLVNAYHSLGNNLGSNTTVQDNISHDNNNGTLQNSYFSIYYIIINIFLKSKITLSSRNIFRLYSDLLRHEFCCQSCSLSKTYGK